MRYLPLTAILVLASLASGCVSFPSLKPPVDDVAVKREARAQQALADFERRRDGAQLEAASDRYSQGDLTGCRELVMPLLERQPDAIAPRLLLAHVYRDLGQPAEAERELRTALAAHDTSAAIHYELGLLLDEQRKAAEALVHLRRAVELEPQNDLYALSLRALASGE